MDTQLTPTCPVMLKGLQLARRKHPTLLSNGAVLHHDNTQLHMALWTWNLLLNLCWEILDHTLYSLDLAPSNFHMFHAFKAHLSGHHFPLTKMSNMLQAIMWLTHTGWTNLPQAMTI